MLHTTEKILDTNLADRAFGWLEINHALSGTSAARYALINKALRKNELIKLKRDTFILAKKYRSKKLNRYYLANRLVWDSYVSMETALAFHQWIPEHVVAIMSVIPSGHTRTFSTPIGDFYYKRLPVNTYEFLTGVNYEQASQQPFLMATPLRALCDLVYLRKVDNANVDFLQNSLRIEKNDLDSITYSSICDMKNVYRSHRVLRFLNNLNKALFSNHE